MTKQYTVTDDGKLRVEDDEEQEFSEMNFEDGDEQ